MEELLEFLSPGVRIDLKRETSRIIAQLTGTQDGLVYIIKNLSFGKSLLLLIEDNDIETSENVFNSLVNISAEEDGSNILLNINDSILQKLNKYIENKDSIHADLACGILANLSHSTDHCIRILENINKETNIIEKLVHIFCQDGYNTKGASLNFLGSFLSNITQIQEGRKLLMNKERFIVQRLLPFFKYSESKDKRKAIIAIIHNCCFEKEYHEWLLGEDIEIASYLAYPLAGSEELTEEEESLLPIDLQFLPEDKGREDDPDIRALLLESFMQLCATRKGRNIIRDLNIYLILREHHKWEQNERCLRLNEDVVNLLIRTEEEIGEEDLSTVEVPSDLVKKFEEFDSKLLNEEKDQTKIEEHI